ncbi:hypothetical protein A2U01_0062647, partial [Trifolium medium]|nr:hypothetical protein [Trifolium medium]
MARMMIDIDDGVMKVRVQDEEKQVMKPSPLEQALTNALNDIDSDEEQVIKECLNELDALKEVSPLEAKLEELKD